MPTTPSRDPWFLRFASALLVAGLLAGLLTGCGDRPSDYIGTDEDEDPADPPTVPGGPATCTIDSVTGTVGDISITFSTDDPDDDTVSVFIQYSTNTGATYTSCTPAASNTYPNGGSGLLTTTGSVFVWDSVADVGTAPITVRIRIVVADPYHPAGSCVSTDIGLNGAAGGGTAPTCAITGPSMGATLGGDISISYSLTDDDNSTTASIMVEYSTDGSVFATATLAAGSSDGISGLSTSTSGEPHTFLWDSATDLPAKATTPSPSVTVRITPSDGDGTGTSCTSATFTVDGNAPTNTPPSCTIINPSGGATLTSDVTVDFTLTDGEQTSGDITVSFSTDSGASYAAATERTGGASEGTTGLAMSVAGTMHTFVWDSATDVPGQTSATVSGVRVRVQASDGTLTGTPCQSMDFSLDAPRMVAVDSLTAMSPDRSIVYNDTACCGSFASPVVLTASGATQQLLVEVDFNRTPTTEDVTMATSASGATTYLSSDTTVVSVDAGGLLTAEPTGANRCAAITITYTPDGVAATGSPEVRVIAACFDVGGSTYVQRVGPDGMAGTADDALEVGDVDVSFPGSASAVPAGAGSTFDLTFTVNAGVDSLGAYSFDIMFTNTVVEVDTTQGDMGVSNSITNPGFTVLTNPENPLGRLRISGFSVATTNTGVFDLLAVHMSALAAGTSPWDLMITDLASTPAATPIGAATPRNAFAGTGTIIIP